MKVGIYPGAFDPIHDGHVAFARAALFKHGLDKVWFLPEPNPRHKQAVKALQHRVEMVRLATADESHFGVILLEQARFTVHDTWPLLTSRFAGAELYMLLGSDVASRLAAWPHIDELVKTAPRFVVALRGSEISEAKAMMQTLQDTKKLELSYSLLAPDYPEYASRKIRHSLKNGHKPHGLHAEVLEYINQQGLYMSGAT